MGLGSAHEEGELQKKAGAQRQLLCFWRLSALAGLP